MVDFFGDSCFDNKTVLLTGSEGHLGKSISAKFQSLGAYVIETDILKKNEASPAKKTTSRFIHCNLSDTQSIKALLKEVALQADKIDILINNAAFVGTSAGKGWAVPVQHQSTELINMAYDINVIAPFLITREVQGLLENSLNPSVIFVSSVYGWSSPDFSLYDDEDFFNPAGYCTSKAAVISLANYFASLLAPKIRVNSVAPGGIIRGHSETFVKNYRSKTLLERMCTEEDAVNAILFLASEMSSYITAQVLKVDGGWGVK